MAQKILLGGHRGLGCTDHDFYQTVRDIPNLPVENTTDSIAQAFAKGASYVEIDAVETADKQLIVLHNVVPKDHFFADAIPAHLLNQLTWNDIRRFKTGRSGVGEVALLNDVLAVVADQAPGTGAWKINIELKHLAGSNQPFADDGFYDNVAACVRASGLADSDILFSSFGFINIQNMSHRLPDAQYGQLFRERKDGDDTDPPAIGIYTDHRDDARYRYLPFHAADVDQVLALWAQHAHPAARLGYMHPEIMTVGDAMVTHMAEHGLGLNIWALFEPLPDAARQDIYRHVAQACAHENVPVTFITDYLDRMQTLFPQN